MGRIRLEWSNLWDILGEHFNKVCHVFPFKNHLPLISPLGVLPQ